MANNTQRGTGIRCPKCKGGSCVKNSVPMPEESIMKRYRECLECGARFVTEEEIVHTTSPRGATPK